MTLIISNMSFLYMHVCIREFDTKKIHTYMMRFLERERDREYGVFKKLGVSKLVDRFLGSFVGRLSCVFLLFFNEFSIYPKKKKKEAWCFNFKIKWMKMAFPFYNPKLCMMLLSLQCCFCSANE